MTSCQRCGADSGHVHRCPPWGADPLYLCLDCCELHELGDGAE